MNLREESKKIKSQADQILKDSGIVEILKNYGEVKIAGSYALDLMLRPDLDIFLIVPEHKWENILEIQEKITKLRYFREIGLKNWIEFSKEGVGSHKLLGYYLYMRIPIEDQVWKIDLWIITPDQDKSAERTEHFKKLLENATESHKSSMLEIKFEMREKDKYIKGVDGKLIYRAVLEEGITSAEEFKEFLKNNK